jgi:hypothetical protein
MLQVTTFGQMQENVWISEGELSSKPKPLKCLLRFIHLAVIANSQPFLVKPGLGEWCGPAKSPD